MGIGTLLPSIHKSEGWKGQYQRMIRWFDKFKTTDPGHFESPSIHDELDILYACFQNIFYLKDWLHYDAKVEKKLIHNFIAEHVELQLCRDICNGTKHFRLTQASVEDDFTIIREYEPFHKTFGTKPYKVVILSGGNKFDLKELAFRCIELWEIFIRKNIPEIA